MKSQKLSVKSFHAQLQKNEGKGVALFAVLNSLTSIKDPRKLSSEEPSPLGSWSGWSY